jgi:DAK2 domain fusion protein YloV
MGTRTAPTIIELITSAAATLKQHREEIDRLNVFPVPDGDTGTNMSLTMDAVLAELARLPETFGAAEVCHAVTQGSLMGARGNSGVILSQILRGLCAVVAESSEVTPRLVVDALARAETVSYQAVRKPVEGTMLTVVKDAASAAAAAVSTGSGMDSVLDAVVSASWESVRRGPELLPVLKEAGVVDAGGSGLAVLAEGFVAALGGHALATMDLSAMAAPVLSEPANDWDDTEHLYCTEFLLHGDGLDREAILKSISASGGSELVVGDAHTLKIHVHTDDPASVLAYVTALGEVSDAHINNMRLQTATRQEELAKAAATPVADKPIGFVAVAAGAGLAGILTSLGVDVIVNGGQTMNPSTAELLEAIRRVPAESVIIMPDNKNIHMAANAAAGAADKPVGVVPTTSVPQAFSAMLAFDPEADLETNVAEMTEAASAVRTGEVTTAIKDSIGKAGRIAKGQIIGISDHEIEVVGEDVADVAARLLDVMADGRDTLTLLGGEDLTDTALEALAGRLSAAHPELEVESHRGDQPLYPVIMAVE